uniref:Uncharacterized protein n=1 Tax=Arundo donax TaxID=35708 RepID=A0A0A9HIA2_ARUDO
MARITAKCYLEGNILGINASCFLPGERNGQNLISPYSSYSFKEPWQLAKTILQSDSDSSEKYFQREYESETFLREYEKKNTT